MDCTPPAIEEAASLALRRICYVCEATQGGVRKHLRDLFRHFSRPGSGYHVHAILGDRGETGFHEELRDLSANGAFSSIILPELRRAIRPWRDLRAYLALKEQLREAKPDIVHTHSSKGGFLGRETALNLGISRVFHTPHVFPFQWTSGLLARIYIALERHVAAGTTALVCVGDSQRADAVGRRICPPEKLVVIRNGITLPRLPDPAERAALRAKLELPIGSPVIGMVARLMPQKGVGQFVRAMPRVFEKVPNALVVVVGGPLGGKGEAEVRARMNECGVPPDRVRLLGHRSDAAMLYPAFDIVALSSLYEGLPYVLLEAMAYGVPVVATDVLGSRDVVTDGETGFLARVADPDHIASQMLRLLQDPSLCERCGRAGRERVAAEFSYEAFIQGHERLYAG